MGKFNARFWRLLKQVRNFFILSQIRKIEVMNERAANWFIPIAQQRKKRPAGVSFSRMTVYNYFCFVFKNRTSYKILICLSYANCELRAGFNYLVILN